MKISGIVSHNLLVDRRTIESIYSRVDIHKFLIKKMYIKNVEDLFPRNDEEKKSIMPGCGKMFFKTKSFVEKLQAHLEANDGLGLNQTSTGKDDVVSDEGQQIVEEQQDTLSLQQDHEIDIVAEVLVRSTILKIVKELESRLQSSVGQPPSHLFPVVYTRDKKVENFVRVDSIYDSVKRFFSVRNWFDQSVRDNDGMKIEVAKTFQEIECVGNTKFHTSNNSLVSTSSDEEFYSCNSSPDCTSLEEIFYSCNSSLNRNLLRSSSLRSSDALPKHIFPVVYTWDKESDKLLRVDSIYDPVKRYAPVTDWFDKTGETEDGMEIRSLETFEATGFFEKKNKSEDDHVFEQIYLDLSAPGEKFDDPVLDGDTNILVKNSVSLTNGNDSIDKMDHKLVDEDWMSIEVIESFKETANKTIERKNNKKKNVFHRTLSWMKKKLCCFA